MLGDVNINVIDGGLGNNSSKGDGIHIKIGASNIESSTPITIKNSMDLEKINELLGLTPLKDAVLDSLENGSKLIYCIPVKPSVEGTIGEIKATKTGTGNITFEGKPNNSYDITVKIVGQGAFNEAIFKYSIDGEYSYSDELTVPTGGKYLIAGTGLTIKFEESAENAEQSFLINDMYKVSTEKPQMSNSDVLSVIDKIKNLNLTYEYVHIVGESTVALWSALAIEAEKFLKTYYKPLFFILEARKINENEDLKVYVDSLIKERKTIKCNYLQVVTARSSYLKMDGTTKDINNAAIVSGLYAKANVQQSIGEVRNFSLSESKMLKLLPEGIEEYIKDLDEAGFLTFRKYEGLSGYYVSNANMLSDENSDYKYAERVRVSNKMVKAVRKEALLNLQSQVDMEDSEGSIQKIAQFATTPLDEMKTAKEISSARIVVPEDQDVLTTESISFKIYWVPIGIVREINIDMSMENPLKES